MFSIGIGRTNNAVEGWHRAISEHIGCKHPCLYRFLENVIEVQAIQECKIAKIESGEEPDKPKRKYRDYEARLKRLTEGYKPNFNNDELVRYVRSISSVLNFDITIRKKITQEHEKEEDVDDEKME